MPNTEEKAASTALAIRGVILAIKEGGGTLRDSSIVTYLVGSNGEVIPSESSDNSFFFQRGLPMPDPEQLPAAGEKQIIYQDKILTLTRQSFQLPGGDDMKRIIVELPARVLIVPIWSDNTVLYISEFNAGAREWQSTLPGGKIESEEDPTVWAQLELRQETGFRGSLTRLQSWYAHPGLVRQIVHVFIARDLVWDPLPGDEHEQIRVYRASLAEALATTRIDSRWDPEAALALWLYSALPRPLAVKQEENREQEEHL